LVSRSSSTLARRAATSAPPVDFSFLPEDEVLMAFDKLANIQATLDVDVVQM